MTIGRGTFDLFNIALLLAAVIGAGLFVFAQQSRVAIDPIGGVPRSRVSASLAMNALVSTVMMATLVVGPFYLARALGLDAALSASSCRSARLSRR